MCYPRGLSAVYMYLTHTSQGTRYGGYLLFSSFCSNDAFGRPKLHSSSRVCLPSKTTIDIYLSILSPPHARSRATRARRALFGRHAAADSLRRIISSLAGCVRSPARCKLDIFIHSFSQSLPHSLLASRELAASSFIHGCMDGWPTHTLTVLTQVWVRQVCLHSARMILSDVLNCTAPPVRVFVL